MDLALPREPVIDVEKEHGGTIPDGIAPPFRFRDQAFSAWVTSFEMVANNC